MLGGHHHLVGLGQCEVGAQDEVAIGLQLVTDPPQPKPADLDNARNLGESMLGSGKQGGVHGVHEPAVDLPGRLAQYDDDGHGDDQPDDGIGQLPACGDATCTEHHRERGEPVGAGMEPVGDQGRRADATANADAVAGDKFVTDEAEDTGGGDRP